MLEEDAYKLNEPLQAFEKHKRRMPRDQRDINHFRNYHDFIDTMEPHMDAPTKREMRAQDKLEVARELRIVHDGPEGRVVVPLTMRAAQLIGQGTRWCISSKTSEKPI